MARQSTAAQRTLTLTEELEKLEQSITLTMQEIDHNFSRAHRIVTSSILPIVEQYADHSRDVWEGSKFWKQFFEASANVSLNGYEEGRDDEEDEGETALGEGGDEDDTINTNDGDDGDLLSQSTPASRTGGAATPTSQTPASQTTKAKANRSKGKETPSKANTPGGTSRGTESRNSAAAPSPSPTPSGTLPPETPRAQTMVEDSTVSASTPELPSFAQSSRKKTPGTARRRDDALLHRGVLDKNYRVQATPMSRSGKQALISASREQTAMAASATGRRSNPQTPGGAATRTGALNFDLDSSPMEEAPQIRSSLFPAAGAASKGGRRTSGALRADWEAQRTRDRVPGVSILEASDSGGGSKPRLSLGKAARQSIGAAAGAGTTLGASGGGGWDDSDEDEDAFAGMSPPKTVAFNIPVTAARLAKTPAREASRIIVQDLLATAGGDNMTEELDSPSVIGKQINFEEDTF